MSGYKILVTGGLGFLGRRIVEELMADNQLLPIDELRILHINDPETVTQSGIKLIKADIRDAGAVERACEGVDAVIHCAALVDWGTRKPKEVYEINYTGTQNIVEACQKNRVRALVFTSSLDAVYTGHHLRNVDEGIPYPERFPNMYCQSKSEAEQLVLNSCSDQLYTCALRPADIWGEADPYHLDSLVDMARGGFYVRLGNGRARCQHVYVGNCAYAHVLAVKALLEKKNGVNGQAYFITDGPPENFFKFFDQVVIGSGYKIWPKNLWLPKKVAYAIGAASEFIAWLVRPVRYYTPRFSRFAVNYTCTDFTFTSTKARQHLSFREKYSSEEAYQRTVAYYRRK